MSHCFLMRRWTQRCVELRKLHWSTSWRMNVSLKYIERKSLIKCLHESHWYRKPDSTIWHSPALPKLYEENDLAVNYKYIYLWNLNIFDIIFVVFINCMTNLNNHFKSLMRINYLLSKLSLEFHHEQQQNACKWIRIHHRRQGCAKTAAPKQ